MARLDRLAPIKEVAQIGSVIGREFSHELLAAVTSLDDAVALQQHSAYYDQLDRNAKRFAAALLMPPERVREDAAQLFIALRAASLGQAELTRVLTIRLAQRYAVSVTAMRHRLGEWPIDVQKGIQQAFMRGLPALPR